MTGFRNRNEDVEDGCKPIQSGMDLGRRSCSMNALKGYNGVCAPTRAIYL